MAAFIQAIHDFEHLCLKPDHLEMGKRGIWNENYIRFGNLELLSAGKQNYKFKNPKSEFSCDQSQETTTLLSLIKSKNFGHGNH